MTDYNSLPPGTGENFMVLITFHPSLRDGICFVDWSFSQKWISGLFSIVSIGTKQAFSI